MLATILTGRAAKKDKLKARRSLSQQSGNREGEREGRLVRGPLGQRKGGPDSGTEPYDARV